MTKMSTVRALNDSGPQLQIVEAVREMQSSLQALPPALAGELTETMRPLLTLQSEVRVALSSFETISAVQRASIEALAGELTSRAVSEFQSRAEALTRSIETASSASTSLRQAAQQAASVTNKMQGLPQLLQEREAALRKIGASLSQLTAPRWQRLVVPALMTGAVAGVVAAIGIVVSNLLLPSAQAQACVQHPVQSQPLTGSSRAR